MSFPPAVGRWSLAALGGIVLVYAMLVLGFAATTPDLGLRFLLAEDGPTVGPTVRNVLPTMRHRGQYKPKVGDQLIGLGGTHVKESRWQEISTFLHFTNALKRLRGDTPFDGKLLAGSNPSELSDSIPSFVEIETDYWLDRDRWVEARFLVQGQPEPQRTWLQVQSLSLNELGLPLVWFVLELMPMEQ